MPATPFLGQVIPVPYNFAPQGLALCNGQLLSIAEEYIGTVLAAGHPVRGDGKKTFGLPNLQGASPIHIGQGTDLVQYVTWRRLLWPIQSRSPGTSWPRIRMVLLLRPSVATTIRRREPTGPGRRSTRPTERRRPRRDVPGGDVHDGGGQPHENRQPDLVVNYVIALQGIFPSELARSSGSSMGDPTAPREGGSETIRCDVSELLPDWPRAGRRLDRADDLPGGQGRDDRLGRPAGDPAVPRLPRAHGPGRRRPEIAAGHASSPDRAGQRPPARPRIPRRAARGGTMLSTCRGHVRYGRSECP